MHNENKKLNVALETWQINQNTSVRTRIRINRSIWGKERVQTLKVDLQLYQKEDDTVQANLF